MKRLMGLALALVSACGFAQNPLSAPMPGMPLKPIVLWPGGAPGAQGTAAEDTPSITPFLPIRPRTTTAVLVIPGGGYSHLSLPTEGVEIAQFLNAAGIPAFVLSYRLGPKYRHPAQLEDGQRALRYIRAHAAAYKVGLVGVMGFSAGGHLASELGVRFDKGKADASDPVERMGSRPDFLVLGYAVIDDVGPASESSMQAINPDPAAKGLEGVRAPKVSAEMVEFLSTDKHVTAETPPAFLVCADDDKSVYSEDSVRFYLALNHAGVSSELHVYAHGRHAFGLAAWDPIDSTWTAHLLDWMRASGFLPPLPVKR